MTNLLAFAEGIGITKNEALEESIYLFTDPTSRMI